LDGQHLDKPEHDLKIYSGTKAALEQ